MATRNNCLLLVSVMNGLCVQSTTLNFYWNLFCRCRARWFIRLRILLLDQKMAETRKYYWPFIGRLEPQKINGTQLLPPTTATGTEGLK